MDAAVRQLGYREAETRLGNFLREEDNWDCLGGKPASYATWNEANDFLKQCEDLHLPAPDSCLDHYGTITFIWMQDGWTISSVFSGKGSYWVIGLREVNKDIQPRFNETLKTSDFPQNLVKVLINKEDVRKPLNE